MTDVKLNICAHTYMYILASIFYIYEMVDIIIDEIETDLLGKIFIFLKLFEYLLLLLLLLLLLVDSLFICRCLPPDRTWHKSPKADYSGDKGEG